MKLVVSWPPADLTGEISSAPPTSLLAVLQPLEPFVLALTERDFSHFYKPRCSRTCPVLPLGSTCLPPTLPLLVWPSVP